MKLRIIFCLFLICSGKLFYPAFGNTLVTESSFTKAWWNSLSQEWKSILLISQNFSKQHTDICELQIGYLNRLNSGGEAAYSPLNLPLHEFFEKKKYVLSYRDFYARALQCKRVIKNELIDLNTLGDLDIIYMVNGPADLAPLKKFVNLRVLILNNCGTKNNIATKGQLLNLEPLRYLNKLEILHCSSGALQSVEPIKDLVALVELRLDNSGVTDLSPLKRLVNLELLSVGSKAETAAVIEGLINLNSLYLKGCKKIPDLSRLEKLRSLSIEENDLSVIDNSYRIKTIEFLKNLDSLEYLDLDNTSYKGNLTQLDSFQNLKAITLPPVNGMAVKEFCKSHCSCVIINAFLYEK